ncbi:hypothetical protein D9M69_730690 [compost metagenome]
MPSVVCGRVVPNVAITVVAGAFSLKSARSELRRSVAMPGQPGSSEAAIAISALGTPSIPDVAIDQVNIWRSSEPFVIPLR